MNDGKPSTDPPTEAHDANRLGGEEPPFYAAAAALEDLDADLTAHSDSTGGVHGVPAGDTVAGQADVDDVTTDLNAHETSSSGVHGVGASNVESEAGAASKVDSHESKPNPHSNSETPAGAQSKVDGHEGKGNPHSGSLASADYNPEADTHSRYTDSEASSAAPVQSVDGMTGNVSVSGTLNLLASGTVDSGSTLAVGMSDDDGAINVGTFSSNTTVLSYSENGNGNPVVVAVSAGSGSLFNDHNWAVYEVT